MNHIVGNSYNTPYFELHYNNGVPLFSGIIEGKYFAESMRMTYDLENDDTCSITYKLFDPSLLDDLDLARGLVLRVSWGYIGTPLHTMRLMYVFNFKASFKADGMSLTIDMVDKVAFTKLSQGDNGTDNLDTLLEESFGDGTEAKSSILFASGGKTIKSLDGSNVSYLDKYKVVLLQSDKLGDNEEIDEKAFQEFIGEAPFTPGITAKPETFELNTTITGDWANDEQARVNAYKNSFRKHIDDAFQYYRKVAEVTSDEKISEEERDKKVRILKQEYLDAQLPESTAAREALTQESTSSPSTATIGMLKLIFNMLTNKVKLPAPPIYQTPEESNDTDWMLSNHFKIKKRLSEGDTEETGGPKYIKEIDGKIVIGDINWKKNIYKSYYYQGGTGELLDFIYETADEASADVTSITGLSGDGSDRLSQTIMLKTNEPLSQEDLSKTAQSFVDAYNTARETGQYVRVETVLRTALSYKNLRYRFKTPASLLGLNEDVAQNLNEPIDPTDASGLYSSARDNTYVWGQVRSWQLPYEKANMVRLKEEIKNQFINDTLEKAAMSSNISMVTLGDPYAMYHNIVNIQGVSRNLSGLYYCKKVVHSIDNNGYLTTCDLIQNPKNVHFSTIDLEHPTTKEDKEGTVSTWRSLVPWYIAGYRKADGTMSYGALTDEQKKQHPSEARYKYPWEVGTVLDPDSPNSLTQIHDTWEGERAPKGNDKDNPPFPFFLGINHWNNEY